ncbi:hypothetical protein [Streptomyces sp. NPDC059008]|uniref:hypothetical protein n=1 Tax=unclassified Streptomyces TaxID=2593676 RepID=UPI0036C6EAB9
MERATDRPKRPAALEMPRQAPPVDRNGTTPGAHSDTTGVEADGFLTNILAKMLPI